jgi:putative ABC transport system permease protein
MHLSDLTMDVRFALRQLRRAPGLAAIVVATLALGIGANSAVFALADAALLRALPFRDPGRLVMAWERRGDTMTTMPSPAEFHAWSERARSFEAMSTLAAGGTLTMAGADGLPVLVPSMTVEFHLFDVLGVPPLLGRTFHAADVTASPTALVMSEGLWRGRFRADPDIIGRSIPLGGRAMTVIGVMPARAQVVPPFAAGGTATSQPADLFTVGSFDARGGAERAHFVHVIGRLREGVPIETAQQEVDGIARDLAQASSTQAGHGVLVQPLRDALIGTEVRRTSLVLLGAVAFLLTMCCANLANLLLARTAGRARELAVRSALGAARRRLAWQLLTESLTLAALGGLAGLLVAMATLRAAATLVPPGLLPNALALGFDRRVAVFCAVVTAAVGVLFGLAPAWQSTGASLAQAAGGAGRSSRRSRWLSSVLIGAEVTAAVLVVSGSGLLLRTWAALEGVDPGYRAAELLTATVNLPFPAGPSSRYPDAAAIRNLQRRLERELTREPQVARAAWGSALPLDGGWFAQPIRVDGALRRPDGVADVAAYHMVSPAYFETLGLPILRGRALSSLDATSGVPVCVVSEAFVRRYLGTRDPIGTRIEVPLMAFGAPHLVLREIVGVARQVKATPDETGATPQLYVPLEQNAWWSASLMVAPRQGRADALMPLVRAALARVDRRWRSGSRERLRGSPPMRRLARGSAPCWPRRLGSWG